MSDWDKNLIETLENSPVSKTTKKQYDSESIRKEIELRSVYDFIGDIILGHLNPDSIIHWGCRSGLLLERFFRHGLDKLFGIEEDPVFLEYWNNEIIEQLCHRLNIADLHSSQVDTKFDMAICLVGETISEENVRQFIENITKSSSKWIWFCGRAVGDVGDNCQPLSFWEDAFAEESDFRPEWEKTFKFKQEMLDNHGLVLGTPWLRDNLIIFKNEINLT